MARQSYRQLQSLTLAKIDTAGMIHQHKARPPRKVAGLFYSSLEIIVVFQHST